MAKSMNTSELLERAIKENTLQKVLIIAMESKDKEEVIEKIKNLLENLK